MALLGAKANVLDLHIRFKQSKQLTRQGFSDALQSFFQSLHRGLFASPAQAMKSVKICCFFHTLSVLDDRLAGEVLLSNYLSVGDA